MKNNNRTGFTFIELLVVIALIAILTLSVIYFLNPAQLTAQGRDSNRLSDLTTLNQNISLYHELQPAGNLGTAGIIYVSIPDPNATTTAGTNCAGLGLPAGNVYHCAASSTYRMTNGTGWVPINFGAVNTGNLLPTLPVDPVNTTSSGEYYVYVTGGSSQYEVIANPEAQKTIANSTSSFTQGNALTLATFPGTTITYTTTTYTVSDALVNFISFDSHTNTIWTVAGGTDSAIQINDTTYATSSHPVGSSPVSVIFDPHNNSLWVTNLGNGTVTQMNDTTYATSTYNVGPFPTNSVFDSHTNTIWIINSANSSVTKIDDTTHATSTYALGDQPYAIIFDPHTNTLWLTNFYGNSITQINDTTYATSTYSFGSSPDGIAFDPNTNTIWVMNYGNGTVTVMNDTTYATSTYALGWLPQQAIAFDSHTNSIWMGDYGDGLAVQMNDTTYVTSSYGVSHPINFVFDSHTNAIWIVGQYTGTLTQLAPSR